ncbi:hypothetical protein [Actinoplanes sp. NBRC 101535]|uniref:hypothetical protein n=1 Tax=Actinoplanes sp. NBRC 101535 TaxID=3032196 RepID=UPI0024A3025B|nr:hypothetical protein [Actinoplanes sp. NBRC 101535]GLY06346.1 hypothetical protein Acsp01_67250 [Actinoplanes sp. NBRC 101535]
MNGHSGPVGLLAAVLALAPAGAGETSGPGFAGVTVATGLSGPRGLAFGESGELYVAERTGVGVVGFDRSGPAPPSWSAVAAREAADPLTAAGPRRGRVEVTAGTVFRVGVRGRLTVVARAPAGAVAVAQAPDGSVVVAAATRVWRIEAGAPPRVLADGFRSIVDLACSPEGVLYVLDSTALLAVGPGGRRTTVASTGLVSPGGLAVRGRFAYVTVCAGCPVGGTVVRIPR